MLKSLPDTMFYKRVWLAGFRSRWYDVRGRRIHMLDTGPRGSDTLVLLHGVGSCAVHYHQIMPALRRYVGRVVAVDMPGHGRSDAPAPATSEEFWHLIFDALDALDVDRFALFGNSLGGFAATRYAASRPERVHSLLLSSPAGAPLAGADLAETGRLLRLDSHRASLVFLDRFMASAPGGLLRHIMAASVRQTMNQPIVNSVIEWMRDCRYLAEEELGGLRSSVYLLWGERDEILPKSSLEFFARNLPPGAVVDRPAHLGHVPYFESPRDLVQRMCRFIYETRPNGIAPSTITLSIPALSSDIHRSPGPDGPTAELRCPEI